MRKRQPCAEGWAKPELKYCLYHSIVAKIHTHPSSVLIYWRVMPAHTYRHRLLRATGANDFQYPLVILFGLGLGFFDGIILYQDPYVGKTHTTRFFGPGRTFNGGWVKLL